MKSPITGREMKLMNEQATLSFGEDKFSILYHFYLCTDTNERFTDDALDNINLTQVHEQYLEKFGISIPSDLE